MTDPALHSIDFRDDNDHQSPSIEYILENELMAAPLATSPDYTSYTELRELYNRSFVASCSCTITTNLCSAKDHCSHGGNYTTSIHRPPELLLNPDRRVHDLIYECSTQCPCPPNCGNRLVQFGPRLHLKIVNANHLPGSTQLGLVSKSPVEIGAFICEYAGELLTVAEAQRRHDAVQPGDMNYIVCLIERSTGEEKAVHQTYIDPKNRGNIGRYLNHSCDPNCEIISVRVDGPVPRLGIFATKRIAAGEELTFDYAGGAPDQTFDHPDKTIRCRCGTQKCRGFLPNLTYE